ncbi:MAG: hypothetical protein PHQ14_10395 [Chromatiales bacterium]|jgi:hypothetical protein|nr:hypothetical protein [Chromatiales bacterium]MDX9768535.1 hypothetical protein [Ectothiorhodospiraceae bacterium]
MFYLELFRSLDRHQVRYLLVGGLAMNLHGVPRMTMDVDLVLALDGENLDAFLRCAAELGLEPQVPVPLAALRDPERRAAWVEQKHMIAFPLQGRDAGAPTVDVLIRHPLDIDAALARSERRDLDGVPVWLAAAEDMVRLKEGTGRRQDADDIAHLRRLRERDHE